MDFFDKLSDTLMSAGREVSDRARDMSDSTRLMYDIRKKKQELDDLYRDLGREYYETHSDSDDKDIATIRDALAEIADMEERYAHIRGGRRCPKCGSVVPLDSTYCNKCGAKLGESIFEDEDDEPVKKASEDVPDEAEAETSDEASDEEETSDEESVSEEKETTEE